MIKHIVMWKFETEVISKTACEKLNTLPGLIKEIVDFEAAVDFNRSAAAFDVVLYSSFNTREDLETYQKHPNHVDVAQYIGTVATERGVVDYEV